MSDVYLSPNVQMEPLVNRWYAWPLLIAPASAAMIIDRLHMRLMRSFVRAPQTHRDAAENPALRGGPFMDFRGEVCKIEALIDETETRLTGLAELSDAIRSIHELLKTEAGGHSLEALYERVPMPLRGFVELTYDLQNQPSVRFLEALLYRSRFYDESLQSIQLDHVQGDGRSFVLSTPRIEEESTVAVPTNFSNRAIDELFRTRQQGIDQADLPKLAERLTVPAEKFKRFTELFSAEAPLADNRENRFSREGVRVRYFGHATLLIETRRVSILIDPVVSYGYASDLTRYTFADLPDRIDYVLITHAHQDHLMFETLLQIRSQIGCLVVPRANGGTLHDPSLRLMLNQLGFDNVVELQELDQMAIPGAEITGVPFLGEHGDLAIGSKLAFHLRLNGTSMLCAADSNNLDQAIYDEVHKAVGNLDALFIGMECDGAPMTWLYGPLLTTPLPRGMDQSRRLNGSNAKKVMQIVDRFEPRMTFVYAMGLEPWLTFISSIAYTSESTPIVESDKVVSACKERGITAERLYGSKELFLG